MMWHANTKMFFIDMKSETYSTFSQYYGGCLQKLPILPAQRGEINSECLNVKPALNSLSCSKPLTKYRRLQLLIFKKREEEEEERADPL